jgi:hypothetical protein
MDGKGTAPARLRTGAGEGDDSAAQVERIGQLLGVVLTCLLEAFPHDFYRRCAFSVFATRALLARDGIASRAVGGRFTSFVVARDGGRYALQGFQDGPERYPHLWVETATRMIDLGPYLLPWGSPFPLVLMPPFIWSRADPLPKGIHYQAVDILPEHTPFSTDPHVQQQAEAFAQRCLSHESGAGGFPFWIACDLASLAEAEAAGDAWVRGLQQFERGPIDHGGQMPS